MFYRSSAAIEMQVNYKRRKRRQIQLNFEDKLFKEYRILGIATKLSNKIK